MDRNYKLDNKYNPHMYYHQNTMQDPQNQLYPCYLVDLDILVVLGYL